MLILLFFLLLFAGTAMYFFLHKKTRMNIKFIFIDNLLVVLVSFLISYLLFQYLFASLDLMFRFVWSLFIGGIFIPALGYTLTMIRFWRTPKRKIIAKKGEVVSPADGNVLYIKKLEKGETPVSIKKGLKAKIEEITQTDILKQEGWLIGINMTPFDVHKNCAPVTGKVILNKHINGEFLSLKEPTAILRNERNTLVLKTEENELFGIVQTSSKLVKRIDSYVKLGQKLKMGDWFGMIRFGSQVDIIIPKEYTVEILIGQQVYAAETIIAKK